MTGVQISVLFSFTASLILFIVFNNLFSRLHTFLTKYWIIGWGLFSVKLFLEVLTLFLGVNSPFVLYIFLMSVNIFSALFIFLASLSLLNKNFKEGLFYIAGGILLAILIILGETALNFKLLNQIILFALGLSFVYSGLCFIEYERIMHMNFGNRIGFFLILWGIQKVNIPELFNLPQFSAFNYFVEGILSILIGICILFFFLSLIEKDLEKSKIQLESSHNIAQIGSWFYDFDKKSFIVQQEFITILQIPADFYMTKEFSFVIPLEKMMKIVHKEDQLYFSKAFEFITNFKKDFDFEFRIYGLDKMKWILFKAIQKGNGYEGIIQDITEIKKIKETVFEYERRLNSILESIELIAIIVDTKGKITYSNKYFLQLTGYEKRDILGQDYFNTFIEPEIQEELRVIFIKNMYKDNIPKVYQNNLILANNQKKMIQWYNFISKDDQGLPTGIIAIGKDLSEYKTIWEQMFHIEKMESLGKLAGGIAHDFNNLLTVIKGYSELILLEEDLGKDLRDNVLEINNVVEKAKSLVTQLLAFARKETIVQKIVNINLLLVDLYKMIKRIIPEDINLYFDLSDDIKNIKIDPHHFDQIIINLIVNAKDALLEKQEATGGFSKKIVVSSKNRIIDETYAKLNIDFRPDEYVMITVYDNGQGMKEEVIEKIFEPFFTTKPEGKGTGLGLATIYGIVRQNNGIIKVESDYGNETIFSLYFPVTSEKEDTVEIEDMVMHNGRDKTILIAEDDETLRIVMAKMLESENYTVLIAENGEKALDIAKRYDHTIDFMISDIIMPKMDGLHLFNEVKKIFPGIKVLFTSGYSESSYIEMIKNKNYPFLHKPFSKYSLSKKLSEL